MSISQRPKSRAILALSGLLGLALLGFALIYLDLPPMLALVGILAGVTIVMMMFRPLLGVHLLVILINVENVLYATEGLTAMKVAGIVVVLGWLLSVVTARRLGVRMSLLIVMLMLFVGWAAVAMVTAIDSRVALVRVLTFAQLGFVAIMFASVVSDIKRLKGVFWNIVICTTLAALYAVGTYYLGLRPVASGTVLDRNLMACYINIAIVCAYFLYQMGPTTGERIGLLTALPVLFLSLALTFSRGGYITFVVALFLVWYRVVKARSYLILAGSFGMILLISTTLPDSFYERVSSIVPSIERQEDTFGIRVLLWKAGLRMVADHPLVGVGPGNFMLALPRYTHGRIYRRRLLVSHNIFVGIAAEMGVVGLAFFVCTTLAALREAGRAGRGLSEGVRDLALAGMGVQVSIVVILVSGLTTSGETSKYLFMLFGMAASAGRLALDRTGVKRHVVSAEASVAPRIESVLHPLPGG